MSTVEPPFNPLAEPVLRARYLRKDSLGREAESSAELLERVATAIAAAEEKWGGAAAAREWFGRFLELMAAGRFLPNSPTLMNAGRELGQLAACFVLPVEDNLEDIFEALKQAALIHKSGGGTGFSFSRLRPRGDSVDSTQGVSSGPVSFMHVFDVATEAIKQGGTRRGANMAMLGVDHPDVEEFIRAKSTPGHLENFNLSVMVSDRFMAAAKEGLPWDLVNPRRRREPVRQVDARALLDLMVNNAHAAGEPGLAFYEAINRANPTPALGALEATNPCGEQPLLPFEACNLGSLALPAFVRGGELDWGGLEEAAALAVRFLDNVVEVNRHPLPMVSQATRLTRKVGLGVMGLADILVDLNLPYDSPAAVELGGEIMRRIHAAARQASARLGKERGNFPAFPMSRLRHAGWVHMRNATVTTVAPTGTLSLLLGCSTGIEPYYALVYVRRVLEGLEIPETNRRFLERLARVSLNSPPNLRALESQGTARAIAGLDPATAALFATAHEIPPRAHLAMQAAFQAHTDNGVSKTVNLAADTGPEVVREIFLSAHELGLKGVTVFRDGSRGAQVLEGREKGVRMMEDSAGCPRCGHTPFPGMTFGNLPGCRGGDCE
ncbi:MAG: adenosylcobalamin-dependent ribonucleoside-diphosphate reductase [Deltaproteobacteria bacterium]|nr:adenosylcobalamin-dependent ribonucleoside-diphosphate reductase [Deltaproteobacteria bacterium]